VPRVPRVPTFFESPSTVDPLELVVQQWLAQKTWELVFPPQSQTIKP
jgi:hypothetical protein